MSELESLGGPGLEAAEVFVDTDSAYERNGLLT